MTHTHHQRLNRLLLRPGDEHLAAQLVELITRDTRQPSELATQAARRLAERLLRVNTGGQGMALALLDRAGGVQALGYCLKSADPRVARLALHSRPGVAPVDLNRLSQALLAGARRLGFRQLRTPLDPAATLMWRVARLRGLQAGLARVADGFELVVSLPEAGQGADTSAVA